MHRRVEILLKVGEHLDSDVLLHNGHARVVSPSAPLRPRVHLERAVVAVYVGLGVAHRKHNPQAPHMIPQRHGRLPRRVGLRPRRVQKLEDRIPQAEHLDAAGSVPLLQLPLQAPKLANELRQPLRVHVVVKEGQVDPRPCHVRVSPAVYGLELLGNGWDAAPEQVRERPRPVLLLNLVQTGEYLSEGVRSLQVGRRVCREVLAEGRHHARVSLHHAQEQFLDAQRGKLPEVNLELLERPHEKVPPLVGVSRLKVKVGLHEQVARPGAPNHGRRPANLRVGLHLDLPTMQESLSHVPDDEFLRSHEVGGSQVFRCWRGRRRPALDMGWQVGR
ncbi:hypothetical protein G6O67_005106 [Ophiocordyceps sinensis]|uniref:Uncharacterized protein n=1 Tax=Ophiocordyceps sinensis TaxID=72228 RepID=A0A8H4PQV9_9HYPO|nr:hypothetical protein G6O67_005106 [Ophiocordyceps sinensis]